MKFIQGLSAIKDTFVSVLALTGALLIIQLVILKKPVEDWRKLIVGMLFCEFGLHFFIKGAELSLMPVGDTVGRNLITLNNRWIVILIAFVIGYFGTLVEPALKTLALEVEEITTGAIPHNILIQAVAIGFGLGMGIGVIRIIKNIPYLYIVVPLLAFILILMFFAPDEFRAISMDSASATTGPVNIPLNMSLAIGLASIIEGVDPLMAGFGIVGLTSVGAVISVLILGIVTNIK